MLFTDLNNYRYATGFSAMIQEHFSLLQEGEHPDRLDWPCYACKQIKLMDQAGVLAGVVAHGFLEFDLRVYTDDGVALTCWWDFNNNCVDPVWLKRYVYGTLPVAV